ncbi:hypothetical protein V6N13_102389 [Hibiscus sabdariffa]|uniref:Uncharacterized protein n=1 Tax=Hibiscus sabdariffa TaxID=183260 RepID=A0ABR2D3Y9_9ROSI
MDEQLDHILRPKEQSPEMWGTNGHNPLASLTYMTRLHIRTLCWSYDEASPYINTTNRLGMVELASYACLLEDGSLGHECPKY